MDTIRTHQGAVRDPQDIVRTEPAVVIQERPEPSDTSSYLVPAAVLFLLLIGGILLAGSVPNSPQVGQEIQRPVATTTAPAPAPTTTE